MNLLIIYLLCGLSFALLNIYISRTHNANDSIFNVVSNNALVITSLLFILGWPIVLLFLGIHKMIQSHKNNDKTIDDLYSIAKTNGIIITKDTDLNDTALLDCAIKFIQQAYIIPSRIKIKFPNTIWFIWELPNKSVLKIEMHKDMLYTVITPYGIQCDGYVNLYDMNPEGMIVSMNNSLKDFLKAHG